MLATKVIEFETSPKENRYGELVGMKIRVELDNDSNLSITGTSTSADGAKNYMGILTLRKANSEEMTGSQEGGDECWVNGVWVTPCPSASGGSDESQPPKQRGSEE